MKARWQLLFVLCVVGSWSAPWARAQVVIHTDDFAGSGGSPHKNVVRDSLGQLYCLSIRESIVGEREVVLWKSTDGTTWDVEFVFNDATSGLVAPELANACAVAIDGQDRIHAIWGRYYYPSNYTQYYRSYELGTGANSPILDISATFGAPPTSRTAAMDIAVDADNQVWIVSHSSSSWREHLLRSIEPYAIDNLFEDVGAISPTASAQNARIAVDVAGRIHCTFYRNVGQGNYEHRIYDPAVGWDVDTTVLGDTAPSNDLYGDIVADALGYVHALYVKNSTTGDTWSFAYRRWEDGGGWGAEVPLFEATPADYTDVANYRIFALACDEDTGRVSAIYRDLPTLGPLVVAHKELDDSLFGVTEEIQPPSDGLNEYATPTVRGAMYPLTNRTGATLDVTWQHRPDGMAPYSLVFSAIAGPLTGTFRRGDANDDGVFDISDPVFSLASLFVPSSPPPTCLDAADANDDAVFDISDPVFMLAALFVPGALPPPAPTPPSCGIDTTGAPLGCAAFGSCP